MAAFQRQARFWIPTEAAGSLLRLVYAQLCAGCPISVGGEPPAPVLSMDLYTAPVEITDALTIADLALAGGVSVTALELNAEAGPGYCDGHIEGPSLDTDGLWKIVFDEAIFETTTPDGYFGAALYADFGDGNVLVGISQFDEPVIALTIGDFVKVSGTLPLPPVVPLVVL